MDLQSKTRPLSIRSGYTRMIFQYEIPIKRKVISSTFQCEVFPERGGMESLYKLA